ncbi:MAG: AIPR family protein [Nitrosomonas sp.]|uniref:MZA anti-phage system associated AIPR family protein MzaE n=1 Tax=Nitrosomonas sp. TaxID=42353 RepID=UPI0025D5F219|nr:MZA anti-phage system associated AIPR family protein MzaE [Nitrosomonas sp.]MBY0473679.1 AIPR family protein [Nitrosomonas sp.]
MELAEFLDQTRSEIREEMNSRFTQPGTEVPFEINVFTETVTHYMSEIGMTFDEPQVCNYEAKVGIANVRLSGYCLSEDADQLDLFVSLYQGKDQLTSIPDSETMKAADHCSRFLTYCVEGKLSSKMDQSTEAYPLVLTIEQSYPTLEQIRIYILTDAQVKTRQFQSRVIQGKTIKLEVMDIVRLYNHWQEGKPRDELVVNFEDISGGPLPCVWVPNSLGEYDYAMTVVPGEALRFLYDKYGTRILEANVRSFLSQTGKVNKGISQTLRYQPDRFMAYNNGIVIVADEARLERTADGGPGISWLKGMQIVNGGQTTASMFFTKKRFSTTDLSQVRVPAKIIVLKQADPAQEEALISDISRFSNTQNKVNQSDLSANRPFHVEMEKLAINTYCPDGFGRWFYERATGSYKVMLEREGKTPAGIKRLQESIPPARKLTKTDLAKYLCAWEQRPDSVSLGGQKNFAAFMEIVDPSDSAEPKLPAVTEYKNMITKIIIFKSAQKLIRNNFPAFQANITAYTVAVVSKHLADKINLSLIWQEQKISKSLEQQILKWANEVYTVLQQSSRGRMISEWAKKSECWEQVQKHSFSAIDSEIPEVM